MIIIRENVFKAWKFQTVKFVHDVVQDFRVSKFNAQATPTVCVGNKNVQ